MASSTPCTPPSSLQPRSCRVRAEADDTGRPLTVRHQHHLACSSAGSDHRTGCGDRPPAGCTAQGTGLGCPARSDRSHSAAQVWMLRAAVDGARSCGTVGRRSVDPTNWPAGRTARTGRRRCHCVPSPLPLSLNERCAGSTGEPNARVVYPMLLVGQHARTCTAGGAARAAPSAYPPARARLILSICGWAFNHAATAVELGSGNRSTT